MANLSVMVTKGDCLEQVADLSCTHLGNRLSATVEMF